MTPELTVVLAAPHLDTAADRAVTALRDACRTLAAEILVAHPAGARGASAAPPAHDGAVLVECSRDALVPELWATGARRARGRVIAFTTAQCVVPPTWAGALLRVLVTGAAGAGGALELDSGASLLDRAVYLLRYSAFMPPPPDGPVAEIAGDNAAYLRATLEEHPGSLHEGFWEVELHHQLRAEGRRLEFAPLATVTFGSVPSLWETARQRFLHGQHFGAYRTRTGAVSRLRLVAAAPIVPLVLTARVLRRALPRGSPLFPTMLAVPFVFLLATAWAAGEASAGWRAARLPAPARAT